MTHKILDKYNELKRERPNLDHELVMTFISAHEISMIKPYLYLNGVMVVERVKNGRQKK